MELPSIPPDLVAVLFFGILIGLPCPYWFAAERIKGFCRAVLMKLPYEPPPGAESEDEAMEEALDDE